jgi:hypothetical protein
MTTLRFLAPGTRSFFGDEGDRKSGGSGGPRDSGGLPAGWSVEVH